VKQQPIVTRLHDTLEQAAAYAAAIADNATDDQQPIPLELVEDFSSQCSDLIAVLASVATR
jgi:hypothetical protein